MALNFFGFFLLLLLLLANNAHSLRLRVQSTPQPAYYDDDNVNQNDDTEPQQSLQQQQQPEHQRQRYVLVSSNQYNGLYGQQSTPAPSPKRQQQRVVAKPALLQRVRDPQREREPPVQTLRNYNKVNDDGSFTFGYEAADGSFKEETRGTDCVVRGKYGYVDPDGNKREFTYVSGNPCDPNAPKHEDDDESDEDVNSAENGEQNYPTRRPNVASAVLPHQQQQQQQQQRPFYQNQQQQDNSVNLASVHRTTPLPSIIRRPSSTTAGNRYSVATTTVAPSSSYYTARRQPQPQPVTITPRPFNLVQSSTLPPKATLFHQYQPSVAAAPSITAIPKSQFDFDAEFQRYETAGDGNTNGPSQNNQKFAGLNGERDANRNSANTAIYSSALVFDPITGQYKNQLYQQQPVYHGNAVNNQNYDRQQTVLPNAQQQQQQQPSQALYHAQQADVQFQNSAQLYAQQQRALLKQQQLKKIPAPSAPISSNYYYLQQPTLGTTTTSVGHDGESAAIATSQLDAFLRGHNIQF